MEHIVASFTEKKLVRSERNMKGFTFCYCFPLNVFLRRSKRATGVKKIKDKTGMGGRKKMFDTEP